MRATGWRWTACFAVLAGCGGAGFPTDREGAPEAVVVADPAEPAEVVEVPRPRWLAAHQAADGSWEAAGYARWQMGLPVPTPRGDGLGRSWNDVAVTSLAALAYFGAGYGDPRHPSMSAAVVRWAIHALEERQQPDGFVGDASSPLWATNHALATWALVTAASLTECDLHAGAASRALAFLARALGADHPAWREEVGPAGLPPVTWAVVACADLGRIDRERGEKGMGALLAATDIPALEGARRQVAGWIGAEGEREWTLGSVAAALLAHKAADERWKDDPAAGPALAFLGEHVPRWEPSGEGVDFGGWLLGTYACFAAGGDLWSRWDKALKTALIDTQRMDGDSCDVKGSWDPVGVWAEDGGRVFSTTMSALVLQVYYRYDKVMCCCGEESVQRAPPPPPTTVECEALPRRTYGRCP